MNTFIDFYHSHQAFFTLAAAWVMRELHNAWPHVKAAWPALKRGYAICKTEGGLWGITHKILFGSPDTANKSTPELAAQQAQKINT